MFRFCKKKRYTAAAPYCAIAVASAAPCIPIRKKVSIKSGSNSMLIMAALILAMSGMVVSAYPRKAPSATVINNTDGAARARMVKYFLAKRNNNGF